MLFRSGLVCLWLAITTARRARGPAALELLSGGLRTPASGLLRWEDLREVRLEDVSLSRTEPGAVPLRRLGIVPVAPVPDERRWTDLPMQGVYRALSWLGPTLRAFRAGTVGEVPEFTSLAPFGALESDLGVPLEAIFELIASRVPVVDAKGRLLRRADALFWPERELLEPDALEPELR